MLLSLSVPAFASEQAVMQQAQLEVEEKVNAAMAVVEDQMVGWDEGYKNAYREIITATIEGSVYLNYGIAPRSAVTYPMPNGGTIEYEYSDNFGDTYYVIATLLDKEDTTKYLLESSNKNNTIRDALIGVVGFIPGTVEFGVGWTIFVFTVSSTAAAFERLTRQDIADAGGYMQMISLVRRGDDFARITISGWHDFYYYRTHPDARNIVVSRF